MPLLSFLQSISYNFNPSTHLHISTLPTGRAHPDTMELQHKAAQLLTTGLATTTRATYTTGQQKFSPFCQTINTSPILVSEHTLILFTTHLASSNITHTTIKVYISAIWHMHVLAGLHTQFNSQLTPHL